MPIYLRVYALSSDQRPVRCQAKTTANRRIDTTETTNTCLTFWEDLPRMWDTTTPPPSTHHQVHTTPHHTPPPVAAQSAAGKPQARGRPPRGRPWDSACFKTRYCLFQSCLTCQWDRATDYFSPSKRPRRQEEHMAVAGGG